MRRPDEDVSFLTAGRVPKRPHLFICIYSAFYVGVCDCGVIFMFLLEEETQQTHFHVRIPSFSRAEPRKRENRGVGGVRFVNSSNDDG